MLNVNVFAFCYLCYTVRMSVIPDQQAILAVHKRYARNDTVFDLVYTHCQIVAEIALWCADNINEPVDRDLLQAACLLHDIGTYALFDAEGNSDNAHNYKQHAIFGSALVLEEGFDPRIADLIRTHVLLGLSKDEVVSHGFGMPLNDYQPTSLEGRLLCYADRFHSKHPVFNAYEPFLARLDIDFPEQAAKFRAMVVEFGLPDVPALAAKYGHPIR